MTIVVLESPYNAPTPEGIARNKKYAAAAMRDCFLNHHEIPLVSHLSFTKALNDKVDAERTLGINAGLELGRICAEKTVVYIDLGTSRGMTFGIEHAKANGRPIEYRDLGPDWEKKFDEQRGNVKFEADN